ncbi:methyl-accepting chemotaxis protein [Nucisporomicrobium flavum]|uniref:methyl-accepting chemotaxis protein n=1 Tax=Nucisporomicrobium flavum TaxID=2785915 RepID=UPI0018F2EF18|nr:HAMP domain-containing methyl-accepting chemotaxis protein [Nucisporomicrobium flavum]
MTAGKRRSLDDLSVNVKVLSAVAAAALVAVIVGVTGLIGLQKTSDAANLIARSNVASIKAVGHLESAVTQSRLDTALQALSPDDAMAKSFADRFAADVTSFGDAMTAYRRSNPAGSPQTISELETTFQSYAELARTKLLPLGAANELDQWSAVRAKEAVPVLDKIGTDLAELDAAETADAVKNSDAAKDTYGFSRMLSLTLLVVGLILALLLGLLVARRIVKSLGRVKAVCDALATNDLTRSSGLTSRDETGQMGQALDAAVASLRRTVGTIDESASSLASASEEMSATAAQIAESAQSASTESQTVSAAAEQISRSVDTVSAGAEEMGASIREISQNATEAAHVAAEAVMLASTTSATMNKLGESSAEIGNVIKVITSIAEQTNLLALNATIEAARAGEMGKGFAVVASEVKDLAQETAKATEDISRRIEAIQADTTGAVTAIDEISKVIARINDYQTTIASAVEEQTATTAEMNRSVSEAATGTGDIARSITGVADAAGRTSRGVEETQQATTELARMSTQLTGLVSAFRR